MDPTERQINSRNNFVQLQKHDYSPAVMQSALCAVCFETALVDDHGSAVSLKTALADNQVLARRVASCQFLVPL
jgi:hypothetical protein